MIEFRIYYECLEQAHDYIAPIIKKAANDTANIKLVRSIKGTQVDRLEDGVIKAIYLLCNPDILITAIKDEIEIPLIFVEFTDSAAAEDHKLQRSAGAVAAYLAKAFYLLVSSDKKSQKKHGGAKYDPYTSARIFHEEFKYEGFIIAEWDAAKNNALRLQPSHRLFGCPPDIPALQETIRSSVSAIYQNSAQWYETAISLLKKTAAFKEHEEKRQKASSLEQLLSIWKARRTRTLRYYVQDDWAGAMIYRFSHAMDPDRGILTFISFLLTSRLKIYGIYSLDRKGLSKVAGDIKALKQRVSDMLDLDKMPAWFKNGILKQIESATDISQPIDAQQLWEDNRSLINSKVFKTLAYLTDGIYLGRDGLLLTWDRWKLIKGKSGSDFIKHWRKTFGFDKASSPSPIREVTSGVVEDEVTYAMIHRVLIPNGFRIVAVSYPGSQGGFAVLPEPTKGRSQKREYLDAVALPPQNVTTFDALLNENKGNFSLQAVMKDVAKLNRYVDEDDHREALQRSLVAVGVIKENIEFRKIMVGVGFGYRAGKTVWQPSTVDFVFVIADRKSWRLGIFSDELSPLIKKLNGETKFPKCFTVGEAEADLFQDQSNDSEP